jgi:cardiolipin synthase
MAAADDTAPMDSELDLKQVKAWRSLNWPNRISILRLLLVLPFVLLLLNQRAWPAGRLVAAGIFVGMALSDWIDGLLARKLGARTRLGAILDPLADKALIICAAVALSLPASSVPGTRLPQWVVVTIVGKDLWVIVGFLVVYLATDRLRVQPTLAGKACTFGQLWMVGLTLIAPELNRLGAQAGAWTARGMAWAAAALSLLAAASYTRLGLRFIITEQKPLET